MTLDVAVSLDWECASEVRNARPVTRHDNGLIFFFCNQEKEERNQSFLKKEGVNISPPVGVLIFSTLRDDAPG
jgi:hypothetical protein